MKRRVIVFIDDDANIAGGIGVTIMLHCRAHDIITHIFTDESQLDDYLRSPLMNSDSIILGIADLWMINKRTLKHNTEAGFLVLEKLRKTSSSVPVIFYSSHIDEDAKRRADKYPNIGLIDKAISPVVFIRLINELVGIKEADE